MERLILGDCLEKLKEIESGSVDAVVTDPPAGISFMNKGWDKDKGGRDVWIAWLASILKECFRVLKDDGKCVVWSIPRTQHWTVCAIEDAGFDVVNCASHLVGSGFPKSMDVSKAIDSAFGVEREVVGQRKHPTLKDKSRIVRTNSTQHHGDNPTKDEWEITAPATDQAKLFQGYGTALKPATENWWIGTKKPEKSDQLFFSYIAKPSQKERNLGLSSRTPKKVNDGRDTPIDNPYQRGESERLNLHPTVKSIALMEYLIQLATSSGTILDPFLGSGTTGMAAKKLGYDFIGIELEKEYYDIATKRIAAIEEPKREKWTIDQFLAA